MLWKWLAALSRETLPALIAVFSFASTILTFVPQLGIGAGIRIIPITCLIGGFIWANVRVYAKQQQRIHDLESVPKSEPHRAKLVIHPGTRTNYIVIRKSDRDRTTGIATYIEFHMAVENKGDRNSNINRYDLEIQGMGKYGDIKPFLNQYASILGLHATSSPSQPYLTKDGYIGIEPEKMTPSGYLPFRIDQAPPRGSGPLRCVLTIADTEGETAAHDFELPGSY